MPMISEVLLKNETLGSSMAFSEASRELVLESIDLGVIEAVINSQDIIGHDGTHITNVRYKPRTVSIVVWLIGKNDSAISALRRKLNIFVNPKQRMHIEQNGYTISGIPLHTALYGSSIQVLNERMCKCLIEVLCDDPLFSKTNESVVGITAWDNKLIFPLKFDLPGEKMIFGLRAETKMMVVENMGDVPVGARFMFTATGSVGTPRITNIVTQETIEININMEAGQQIIVDTSGKIVTAKSISSSGAETNIINLLTADRGRMEIPVGEGRFVYAATENADNLEVVIAYSEKFLEVL